jgi:YVTN family beta-propeller protein
MAASRNYTSIERSIGIPDIARKVAFEVILTPRRSPVFGNIIFGLSLANILGLAASTSAEPMRLAYVANTGDNTISAISLSTHQVIDTIAVGMSPTHVAFSPDGRRAYVSNRDSHDVTVIDTFAGSVIDTVDVENMPGSLAVSRDGGHVYVTNSGSATISIIDTATNTVADTINTSLAPRSIAFHPIRDEVWIGFSPADPGRTLEVRSTIDNSIMATKETKFTVITPYDRAWAGTELVFREDGSEAIGVEGCGLCGRFHRILGTPFRGLIPIVDQDLLFDNTGAATGAAINPIDGTAYLAKIGQQVAPHRIQELGGLGRTLDLTEQPGSLAVSPDGAFLYVVQPLPAGFISIVDTATFEITGSIDVGASPAGIALAMIDTSGDFDMDGNVDVADYLAWNMAFGSTVTAGSGADGNGNGIVDAADYVVWRHNLTTWNGAQVQATVPELSTLLLLISAAFFLVRPGAFVVHRGNAPRFEYPSGAQQLFDTAHSSAEYRVVSGHL